MPEWIEIGNLALISGVAWFIVEIVKRLGIPLEGVATVRVVFAVAFAASALWMSAKLWPLTPDEVVRTVLVAIATAGGAIGIDVAKNSILRPNTV